MPLFQLYGAVQSHNRTLRMSQLFPKFFCKMNDCHMTYIIGPNINSHLFISCNTFDITMEYQTVSSFISNSGCDR